MAEYVDLSELLHTPGMRVPVDVDLACTPELEVDCTSPVTGHLVFTNTGNLLVILGDLKVTVKTTCPRCLEEVRTVRDAPVDEELAIRENQIVARADDEEGVVDPTLADLVSEGYLLNLTELARQSIILAEPMKPLCREDCRGLCPICGANRNETQCECAPAVDSPFAALADLYKAKET